MSVSERLEKLYRIYNGGPGSGNHNPGQGQGIGKPGNGVKSRLSLSDFEKILVHTGIGDRESTSKQIAERLGFTKKPKSVSNNEFEKLGDEYQKYYRGIQDSNSGISVDEIHKSMMDGEYRVSSNSTSSIGAGYYMTTNKEYAESYAYSGSLLGKSGGVEEIAIPRSAKILDFRREEDRKKFDKFQEETKKINEKLNSKYSRNFEKRVERLSVYEYIESCGYSGVENNDEFCLYDRSIAIINKDLKQ